MAGPGKGAAEAAPAEMVTASVARGRTLVIDGHHHGPGTIVSLAVDEHAHLLRLGFLHDPRAPQLTPRTGPQFRGAVDGIVRPT